MATLRNLRRPGHQIYPGHGVVAGRRPLWAPNGREWFAGAGPWCLGPIVRARRPVEDRRRRPGAGRHGASKDHCYYVFGVALQGPADVRASRRRTLEFGPIITRVAASALATVLALTTSSTQVEVMWHRRDFVGEKATIVLAHALVRLANDEPAPRVRGPGGQRLESRREPRRLVC